MQTKVRALIWVDGLVVVAEESRQALRHRSLPGGRPNPGETLHDALVREVREETGLDVRPGRLLYVAESVAPHRAHDLNLVFAAQPLSPLERSRLVLVDPALPTADDPPVLPPLLDVIAADAPGPPEPRWLGNVWSPSP